MRAPLLPCHCYVTPLLRRTAFNSYFSAVFQKLILRRHIGTWIKIMVLSVIWPRAPGSCETDLPEDNRSRFRLISYLTFSWIAVILDKGFYNKLKSSDDLLDLPMEMKAHRNYLLIRSELKKFKDKKLSLSSALTQCYYKEFIILGILRFAADLLGIFSPILLYFLLDSLNNPPIRWPSFALAIGLSLTSLLGSILAVLFQRANSYLALKVRAAVITTVYNKILGISVENLVKIGSGGIINSISFDTDRIQKSFGFFYMLCSIPFQVIFCLYLLYRTIGNAFFASFSYACVIFILNYYCGIEMSKHNRKMLEEKDKRIKLMSEILQGIETVKLYSWEDYFSIKINELRAAELYHLQAKKYVSAAGVFLWTTSPVLIAVITITTYAVMGNQLEFVTIFTALAVFGILMPPLINFPWIMGNYIEANVSMKRVENLLDFGEKDIVTYYSPTPCFQEMGEQDSEIEVKNGAFSWACSRPFTSTVTFRRPSTRSRRCMTELSDAAFSLDEINISIKKGDYIGITGPVGCGKTAFLNMILGEIKKDYGCIYVDNYKDGFGYVSEDVWISQGTIRDNILCGKPFSRRKYNAVIDACELMEDIADLPAGDSTFVDLYSNNIGEKQKKKITLARAVYQDKLIYLLDAPLHGFDLATAYLIHEKCILGLLAEKTRIVCTHLYGFLRSSDYIYILNKGEIVQQGTAYDVFRQTHISRSVKFDNTAFTLFQDSEVALPQQLIPEEFFSAIEGEQSKSGPVSLSLYQKYCEAMGSKALIITFLAFVGAQVTRNYCDIFITNWINNLATPQDSGDIDISSSLEFYNRNNICLKNMTSTEPDFEHQLLAKLFFYMFQGLVNSIFSFIRAYSFAYGGIKAAKKFHSRMLRSIFRAPMDFFYNNPAGRIITRFAVDTQSCDDQLPNMVNSFLSLLFQIIGIILVTVYTMPLSLIFIIPLIFYYFYIQYYFRFTSRELKRMHTVTMAPLFTQFTETLAGGTTIRALHFERRSVESAEKLLDVSQRTLYSGEMTCLWLVFRYEMVAVLIILGVSLMVVSQSSVKNSLAATDSLALTYVLTLTSSLKEMIMYFVEVEKELVSIERICHYIEDIGEDPWSGQIKPASIWPTEGTISLQNVSVQYSGLQRPALDDVSLDVMSGEKIGIVGAIGSGKSTLLTSLFRLNEPQGVIIIDDVNIHKLDLLLLRPRLSIITERPYIFTGTVRDNLDPSHRFTDHQLWVALEECCMGTVIYKLGGLQVTMMNKGQTLSRGQRQLLCLSRVLLMDSPILCIDETTIHLDKKTRHLIHWIIDTKFRNKTVIIVTNQLQSIMNYDYVITMEKGKIVHKASPKQVFLESWAERFQDEQTPSDSSDEEGFHEVSSFTHSIHPTIASASKESRYSDARSFYQPSYHELQNQPSFIDFS